MVCLCASECVYMCVVYVQSSPLSDVCGAHTGTEVSLSPPHTLSHAQGDKLLPLSLLH